MSTSGSECQKSKKKLRGETHVNTVGISVLAKEPLLVNCKCRWKCSEAFSGEVRNKICADYCALGDFARQKDYILQHLTVRPQVVSRELSGEETFSQSRNISVAYYLEYDGFRNRVCQSFFLKILCISNRAVLSAINRKTPPYM